MAEKKDNKKNTSTISGSEFLEGLNEEKSDKTRVERAKPTSSDVVNSQKRKDKVAGIDRYNAERESRAMHLEEYAQKLRNEARNGIEDGKPISKERAEEIIGGYEGAKDWENVAEQQRKFKRAPNPAKPESFLDGINDFKRYDIGKFYDKHKGDSDFSRALESTRKRNNK